MEHMDSKVLFVQIATEQIIPVLIQQQLLWKELFTIWNNHFLGRQLFEVALRLHLEVDTIEGRVIEDMELNLLHIVFFFDGLNHAESIRSIVDDKAGLEWSIL